MTNIKNKFRNLRHWFSRHRETIEKLMACGMAAAFGAAAYKLGYDDGKFENRNLIVYKILDESDYGK